MAASAGESQGCAKEAFCMKAGSFSPVLAALLIQLLAHGSARADEGWWLFNDPPRNLLKDRYQFELTEAWLNHVRLAAVRLPEGGSGPFFSPNGLILTIHPPLTRTLHNIHIPTPVSLAPDFL